MKKTLLVMLFMSIYFAHAQTKKFISLKENFRNLNQWSVDSKNQQEAFSIKNKSLKLNYTKNISENQRTFNSNRIFTKLNTPLSCSFLASFEMSMNFNNFRLFDTIFPLILSSTSENPMNQFWDKYNKTQANQNNIGIYATTFGKLDSFAIYPYEFQNGIRSNFSGTNNLLKLAFNKSYTIEIEMRYNNSLSVHARDPFTKVTHGAVVFGLNENKSIHNYNTANIIFNNTSITQNIKNNNNAAFLSNMQIEDKLWIYPCEKPVDTTVIAKKSKCKINFANLDGKSVVGETNMLKEGDAYCKLGDKVNIFLNADTVTTNKATTIPYIITIVEPNTKNVLVKSSSTSFIANMPGVYTIIVSFNNDEGNCGFYTKYINVKGEMVAEKIKINTNAYFDNNCNNKQDYNEKIESSYQLKITNLKTNEITNHKRNSQDLDIELETGDYEFQYLFQNAKQIMKPIKIMQTITSQDNNQSVLHKLNVCEKKRIAIDPKELKKIKLDKKEVKKY